MWMYVLMHLTRMIEPWNDILRPFKSIKNKALLLNRKTPAKTAFYLRLSGRTPQEGHVAFGGEECLTASSWIEAWPQNNRHIMTHIPQYDASMGMSMFLCLTLTCAWLMFVCWFFLGKCRYRNIPLLFIHRGLCFSCFTLEFNTFDTPWYLFIIFLADLKIQEISNWTHCPRTPNK